MGGREPFRGVAAAPNHAVEPTANSLRSYVASAIGGGSPLALGGHGERQAERTSRWR